MTTTTLPPLREDLNLFEGPVTRDGEPSWTVFDPTRNRYFRIGRDAFDLLSHWHSGNSADVLKEVAQHTGRSLDEGDVEWVVHFLRSNFLVKRSSQEDITQLENVAKAGHSSWYMFLLQRYLFFRIPLIRPQKFLQKTMPFVEMLYTRQLAWAVVLLGLYAIFLVSRQWESFLSTFLHFFSWDGLLWYGLTLIFVKIIHELGHAYTAFRAGCRVPSMGVAFLVMWPVLYTDTTDAWRLKNKKQKLAIGAAGITVELGLALIATLLWSFLPEGAAKSAAFLVATITWIMSLAINLNPLMRFDGYYLLSDWLEIENMQDRSFALSKWWLRERLFGLGEAAPEYFTDTMRRGLVTFGIAVWVYRFFLFLGIAILVYAFFFKLLGIILFLLEILWFIGMPIYKECMEWWTRRKTMSMNYQTWRTVIILTALLLFCFIPWQQTVHLSGLYSIKDKQVIYTPRPAKIEHIQIQRGDKVKKGQMLMTLSSDELTQSIKNAELHIQMQQLLLSRQSASFTERQKSRIVEQQLEGELAKLTALRNQKVQLVVKSPINGIVGELDVSLRAGLWVNEDTPLVTINNPLTAKLTGYVSEKDVERIQVGNKAHFYPDNASIKPFKASISHIANSDTQWLEEPSLASVYGGNIAVEQDDKQRLIPLKGLYAVEFDIDITAPEAIQRGIIHVKANSKSLFRQWFESLSALLVKESSF